MSNLVDSKFYADIKAMIQEARQQVARSINFDLLEYWENDR